MKNATKGVLFDLASVLFISLLVLASIVHLSRSTTHSIDRDIKVQLLGVNDFHGQIDTSKKMENRLTGGADYVAAYLKQWEKKNPNTILVHSGDAVGGSSPTSALLQDEPTITMMNQLGFDVGALGNHEFDDGVKEMKRLIHGGRHPKTEKEYGTFQGANFPYVAANVVDSRTKKPILEPYVIKSIKGYKIGFIGVTISDTPSLLDSSRVKSVEFTDEVAAINKYTKQLKGQGVKAIVVLAHSPGKSRLDGSKPTGDVARFASLVDDEVDIIFGGHNHAYMNSIVDGKLLVQAYSAGTAFSAVNVVIDASTQDIIQKKAEIVMTYHDSIKPDKEMTEMVTAYLDDVRDTINRDIGNTGMELTREFNEAGQSALGSLVADSMREQMGTDFAFIEAAGIRADINSGLITWGELFTALPFGNRLVSITMTGDQVREVLNQQWLPEKRMLQISGLKYNWSNDLPSGQKVIDIYMPSGEKIDPNLVYSVTVNSFLADGKNYFTAFTKGKNLGQGPKDLEALISYVKEQSNPLVASTERRITKVYIEKNDHPKVDQIGAEVVTN
ncbi:bifunctional UDP-sugar hydrolase/5'-nucleotidase [Bacillus sp. V5-8f]|uniref:bifunctional metallophosphatase/5'-nucleotidase n=1 Tax=Bacillus sp. V5-8f TaxID=2053044 RepID=UPI000C760F5F|nr:5'-nucleotidase C-terminal domain-containing protein [Bacillus sp. V5-8f]PLT35641.1 bifunctional metallophosphatase/5'-nucleotidase [Bacillus sp. V5-8f]